MRAQQIGDLLLKFFIYIIGFGGVIVISGMVFVTATIAFFGKDHMEMTELYFPYQFMYEYSMKTILFILMKKLSFIPQITLESNNAIRIHCHNYVFIVSSFKLCIH